MLFLDALLKRSEFHFRKFLNFFLRDERCRRQDIYDELLTELRVASQTRRDAGANKSNTVYITLYVQIFM